MNKKWGKKILVMTAVAAEKDAFLRGLPESNRFDVRLAGVGPAAAAASTATALAENEYELVISVGIAGGFKGQAEVGSLVVASEIIAADLGAETPDGFHSLDELGFGSSRIVPDVKLVKRVTEGLQGNGLPVHSGPVLTVSTVTGTAETARAMEARVPGAAAEAMEGYGVAIAATARQIPILEIRAISNPVGPRDREAWKIKEALDMLEEASSIIMEVL